MSKTHSAKPTPNFYVNDEAMQKLVGQGYWKPEAVEDSWRARIKDHFGNPDTYRLYASGTYSNPVLVELDNHRGQQVSAIAGMDWIREETNPKPGEPPLNAYHYIVGEHSNQGYPVFGPYYTGMRVPHWRKPNDLKAYDEQ